MDQKEHVFRQDLYTMTDRLEAVVILQFVLSDSKVQKMVYEKIKRTVTRIREGYPGYNPAEIYKMQSKNQNKIN